MEEWKKIKFKSPIPTNSLFCLSKITATKPSLVDVAWYRDGIYLYGKKAGSCYVDMTYWTGSKQRIKVTIKNRPPKLQYTSITNYNMGNKVKNKLLYATKKVTWSSSNKKIAVVNSKGTVTMKGVGSCYIYAKHNGKTYKCFVKVVRRNPNFGAIIKSVNTSSRNMVIRFYNCGDVPLYIHITDGYIQYTNEYYRNRGFDGEPISKGGTNKVDPKKAINITIWPGPSSVWYSDLSLHYTFTYDGKKYASEVTRTDSYYKKYDYSSSTYYTYHNDKWYYDWVNRHRID